MLAKVDVLLLMEVYPAGEKPIPGADSRALCRSIRQRGGVEPIYIDGEHRVDEVMESPVFIPACFVISAFLVLNVIVMRSLVNIKV